MKIHRGTPSRYSSFSTFFMIIHRSTPLRNSSFSTFFHENPYSIPPKDWRFGTQNFKVPSVLIFLHFRLNTVYFFFIYSLHSHFLVLKKQIYIGVIFRWKNMWFLGRKKCDLTSNTTTKNPGASVSGPSFSLCMYGNDQWCTNHNHIGWLARFCRAMFMNFISRTGSKFTWSIWSMLRTY